MSKPVVAVTIGKKYYGRMICAKGLELLESFAQVRHTDTEDPADKEGLKRLLKGADACITSWEVARLDSDVLEAADQLKAVVHMGGSVKRMVSDELFDRGIKVFGASPILAETVAESALGYMIIGMKRGWQLSETVRNGGWRDCDCWPSRELRGKTVGLIGASQVGRHLIKLLKPFLVDIIVYDPYLDPEEASGMGVKTAELKALAERSDIVSLHAPANEKTEKMLNEDFFGMMKDDALIVNTARGTLIDEKALVAELEKGRFYAVLDVTDPEPPAADSPLRSLPNAVVLPHIAGCIDDCSDMSLRAAEELRRFFGNEKPLYEITREMFSRIS